MAKRTEHEAYRLKKTFSRATKPGPKAWLAQLVHQLVACSMRAVHRRECEVECQCEDDAWQDFADTCKAHGLDVDATDVPLIAYLWREFEAAASFREPGPYLAGLVAHKAALAAREAQAEKQIADFKAAMREAA